MAAILQALSTCLCGPADSYTEQMSSYSTSEKATLLSSDPRTAEEIAAEVVDAILRAEIGGKHLKMQLESIVGATGWTERVAEWTLAKLERALREASKLGPVMKEAYDKACEAAKATQGFVMDHPVLCTVIALGVLVLIAPWAIEALGFAELGPVEGSFAALWQSRYAGFVPKGSLFSFFQRLGMIWH